MMEYYPVAIVYKNKDYYAIWKTDSVDEFENKKGKIVLFDSVDEAESYLKNRNLELYSNEITVYDLDWFMEKCVGTDYGDCKAILFYWNMFSDMAKSVGIKFKGDDKKIIEYMINFFLGTICHP